jgi:hypothetical protein
MKTEVKLLELNGGIQATRTGLFIPDQLSASQWEDIGRKLGAVESSYQWMVGDWWIWGEKHLGNRRATVESPTWDGPSYKSCATYGWICRVFESSRRREHLTFWHHAAIAALQTSNPELAEQILDWCEAPLSKGKKPRSAAKMKLEINKRLNKHFRLPRREKSKGQDDFGYIEFIGPIGEIAGKHAKFDIPAIARIQVELYGELLEEDLDACQKAVTTINSFIKEVHSLCQSRQKKD